MSEPITAQKRTLRTLGVVLAWMFAAAPLVVGPARCNVAAVFHRPCPGCGMTRAMFLLRDGDVHASLHMHPLVVPVVLTTAFFAALTVWLTWTQGTPLRLWESRVGRGSVYALLVVHCATFLLWGFRLFGFFGGPVPV